MSSLLYGPTEQKAEDGEVGEEERLGRRGRLLQASLCQSGQTKGRNVDITCTWQPGSANITTPCQRQVQGPSVLRTQAPPTVASSCLSLHIRHLKG